MTSEARAAAIVEDLDAALRGPLKVQQITTAEELMAAGASARYLRERQVTFALHFDVTPKFLIVDPLLGTLGIVELVMPSSDPADDIETPVRRCIDRAVYLRHLLLRDGTREGRLPMTVELVVLTADPVSGEMSALGPIGNALGSVLKDGSSLHQIGVSVLSHGGPEIRFEGRLRRAFPWLLTAARRWLVSPRANPEEARNASDRRLQRLKLTNYRLPGVREINLANTRVHLMHGPNGSGKSSIAEALEIVSCGVVERLVQAGAAEKYDDVITHAGSMTAATVQLGWMVLSENRMAEDAPLTISSRGLEPALDKAVSAASFRLDQPLMDRLIGHSAYERAKVFMDAFFPTAGSSRRSYEEAARAHQTALVKVDTLFERLTLARQGLADLQGHRTGLSVLTTDPFPTVLNKWLAQTALVDLLQRQRIVRATIEAAHNAHWQATDDVSRAVVSALSGIRDVATLERFEQECKASVDTLQSQLRSFAAAETTGDTTASPLSRPLVDALNAICPFLFTQDDLNLYGRFGDRIAAVINAGETPTFGHIVIGVEKWAEPVLKDLDALIDAFKSLRADEPMPPEWPGKATCPEYDEARQTHARKLAAGRELTLRFFDKLRRDEDGAGEFDGSLIAALNEMMALCTPARWAYPDILLPSKLEEDRVGVSLHLDAPNARSGADEATPNRAEVRLNTAELNLFTVALFMLCIGCVKKPLNLLILDDPLQNMDELTSTALARGVAKMMRLWRDLNRREELLILFHGYSDLERFASEVAAATYRLPWLSPVGAAGSVPPVSGVVSGVDVLAVQPISAMLPRVSQ